MKRWFNQPIPWGQALHLVVILLACVGLAFAPELFKSPFEDATQRPRARVLSVDNARVIQSGFIKTGSQDLQVEILDGPMQGQEVNAWNLLQGSFEIDKFFSPGDEVILALNVDADNHVTGAMAADFYRARMELILCVVFAAILILFSGWTGARALLSFVFAILLIWKFLVPSFLLGWDPILTSLLMLLVVTVVTMTLVVGLSRTAVVAILGTVAGILLTCGLALLLFPGFHISGAVLQWSETILNSGFAGLNLDHLFIAAVFIGASGAVMDLSIDVSTSMREVVINRPEISTKELIASGLSVGRAMTGTLITTLLMAYVSGELGLVMAFMGRGLQPVNLINTNYLAAELLRTLVGCLGLVMVAPFTALVGGFVYTRRPAAWKQTPAPAPHSAD